MCVERIIFLIKNNIVINLENSFGGIFDLEEVPESGLSAPHSWHIDHSDPSEFLFRHQFVICEQDVIALPYFYIVEKTYIKEAKENMGKSLLFSNSKIKEKEAYCRAAFYSSEHYKRPQDYLQEFLTEKTKEEIGESTYQGKVVRASMRILTIYNPEWVR